MLEREIVYYFNTQVRKELGGIAAKWESPGNAGVPDKIVLLPGGRVAFVELKRPNNAPRKLQEAWLRRLKKLGFEALCLSTKQEIDAWIGEIKNEI